MNPVNEKLFAARKLQKEAAKLIEDKYPKGSYVGFYFRDNQQNLSHGEITGVHKSGYYAGYVAIKTESGKTHNIYHENIRDV